MDFLKVIKGKRLYNQDLEYRRGIIQKTLDVLVEVSLEERDIEEMEKAVDAFNDMETIPLLCFKETAEKVFYKNLKSYEQLQQTASYFEKRGRGWI